MVLTLKERRLCLSFITFWDIEPSHFLSTYGCVSWTVKYHVFLKIPPCGTNEKIFEHLDCYALDEDGGDFVLNMHILYIYIDR